VRPPRWLTVTGNLACALCGDGLISLTLPTPRQIRVDWALRDVAAAKRW
jgi:hypothetical protein